MNFRDDAKVLHNCGTPSQGEVREIFFVRSSNGTLLGPSMLLGGPAQPHRRFRRDKVGLSHANGNGPAETREIVKFLIVGIEDEEYVEPQLSRAGR